MAIDIFRSYEFGPYNFVITRNGSANYNETSSDWEDSYTNWRDGSAKNLNWKEDIAAGRCATTYLKAEKHTVRYTPTFINVSDVGGGTYFGYWAGRDLRHHITSDPSGIDISHVDDLARIGLIRRANKIIRPFQGAVFVGELGETLRQVVKPANGLIQEIVEHITKVKKITRVISPRNLVRTVSDLWLEASFGWSPLLADIEDGIKALTRWDDPTKRQRIISFSASSDISRVQEYSEFVNVRPFRYSYVVYLDGNIKVRYRASLRWDPSHRADWKFSGFSLTDILPAAWEIIPYSFLIDYFTNVGDIVEGLSFNKSYLNWVDRGTARVLRRRSRIVNPHYYNTYWGQEELDALSGSFDFRGEELLATRRLVERKQISVDEFDSIPDFHWEVPGMGRKAINIAALAAGRLL